MQFVIIAYDGTDEGAQDRRLRVRDQHIAVGDEMVRLGKALFGAALLDDAGVMIGSMRVVDWASREELEKWLREEEPYVTGDVWRDVTIRPCRVGPSYEHLLKR
jgi:uncharacterized protein YciI